MQSFSVAKVRLSKGKLTQVPVSKDLSLELEGAKRTISRAGEYYKEGGGNFFFCIVQKKGSVLLFGTVIWCS
jgi:hypothetical protein